MIKLTDKVPIPNDLNHHCIKITFVKRSFAVNQMLKPVYKWENGSKQEKVE